MYHGWPTLFLLQNGEMVLAWSGGREGHVCPFGQVHYTKSRDGGEHWCWPRVILDSGLDDRDAGVLETRNGTLLVTTFSSLAYEPIFRRALASGDWESKRIRRWTAAHNRLESEARERELGQWMIRSEDDGKSWRWLSEIPARDGDDPRNYHELHAVEMPDRRIVVHIRNHNPAHAQEILQCESPDGGRSWTKPRSIGVWGLPSHLLGLSDGRVLMTYGYRRPPFGNQIRISENGRKWSAPKTISDDGASVDLGYLSTVQLKDGTFVTV